MWFCFEVSVWCFPPIWSLKEILGIKLLFSIKCQRTPWRLQNLILFLLTFLNLLNNIDYTITYISLIPCSKCHTRATSELLKVSLISYPYQVLYSSNYAGNWLLLSSGSPLPRQLYANLLSQTESTGWIFCQLSSCQFRCYSSWFLSGCD